MAIVIRDEKQNRSGWFGFGILFVVLAIIGAATYYLFFVKPEIINTVAPVQLQSIDQLAHVNFDPADILGSTFFTTLTQPVPPPAPPTPGNPTPFGSL